MNGAQAVLQTLVACGLDTCFTNPGTSEMHFVAALDRVPSMHGVLTLFEGVATGAADGYARMAGKPAATLLHLGPGLGNGLANLHNARRANSPVVNVVGDHATFHLVFDAPLTSDLDVVARNVSRWIRSTGVPASAGADAADAVAAALAAPGGVATLILPADVGWEEGGVPVGPHPVLPRRVVSDDRVRAVANILDPGERTILLLGGSALRSDGLLAAGRIAAATGCRLLAETFPARLERGAGLPAIDRLAYFGESAQAQLDDAKNLVLVDARPPVTFFAYPGKSSELTPDGCVVHTLATDTDDAPTALAHLADLVAANAKADVQPANRPDVPSGRLTPETTAALVGAHLPDAAIVVDEANTSGVWMPQATAGAPRHDWLTLTGGAIGYGLPAATGAAIAARDRPVVCLEADGSAMYTLQALWTQARENLDITTIVFNNRSYAILNIELHRVGAGQPGQRARELLDLSRPDLDFVALANGLGVDAVRVDTCEQMAAGLHRALRETGPHLIEVML